jgi:uncharacterized protein (TIGR02145 family)
VRRRYVIVTLMVLAWPHATSSRSGPEPQGAQRASQIVKDPRDGKSYRTVQIGTAVWMQENLNYETENSWCYDNRRQNCSKYGRLYTYAAAQTACPPGWHLADETEWDEMLGRFGITLSSGDRFGSQRGSHHSIDELLVGGSSGFEMLLGGTADMNSIAADIIPPTRPGYRLLGDAAYYWSRRRSLGRGTDGYVFEETSRSSLPPIYYTSFSDGDGRCPYAFSVRCVRDQTSTR